ncbi:hypothetical protein [Actinoplanes sp. NPDC051851]|uniref:hypothetical protein n=1 Tax=Actinoplanes sp. NPDC051851 TaxID=3154753 RepID=UPI0034120B64
MPGLNRSRLPLAAEGAGAIAGGLLVGRLLARFSATRVAALGALLFAAACVLWSLPWWPAMIIGSVLAGLGLPWPLIAAVTAIQTHAPDRLLGRASATGTMLMFGPIAVAIPLGAALVTLGATPILLLGAGTVLAAAVGAARTGAPARSTAAAGIMRE